MGIIDDKKNIFTEIGAFNSISDTVSLPKNRSSLSSLNNNEDVVSFLIDLLTVLVGSEVLKSVTGELLSEFSTSVSSELKAELKSQFLDYDAADLLPTAFINNGYTVPARDIDVYDKLKTDPNSGIGKLIYKGTGSIPDFDRKAYDAIQNPNTPIEFRNITISYDDTLDNFTFKPLNGSQDIKAFTDTYISGLSLFDKKTFISEVFDALYGTKTAAQNKSLDQVIKDNKINRTIEKFVNNDNDLDITDNELRELQEDARQRKDGIREIDVGCSVLVSTLTVDDLNNINSQIRNSNDPDVAGNVISDAIMDSIVTGDQTQGSNNEQTIKDGFLKRLINAIIRVLTAAVTVTPQIRALIAIVTAFRNNDIPQLGNPIEDLKNKKDLTNCLTKKSKSLINEFLFNLVIDLLLDLIIPVSKVILKEKINQYIAIIRSLVSFA